MAAGKSAGECSRPVGARQSCWPPSRQTRKGRGGGMQKDAMDVLQAWGDQYNARAGASIALDSGGEAGGAQLRPKYRPAGGGLSILPLVAVSRGGRPAHLVKRVEGASAPNPGHAAGLYSYDYLRGICPCPTCAS